MYVMTAATKRSLFTKDHSPMRSSILAIAAASLLVFAAPVYAQDAAEEEVSEAVDIALWCGAAYSVAAEIGGMSEADAAAATQAADASYAKARVALEEDEVEAGEYERIVGFYVDAAVEDFSNPDAELRYSDEECTALINE